MGTTGAITREQTQPLFLDVHFPTQDAAHVAFPITAQHNAFIYVYRGAVTVVGDDGEDVVPQKRMGILRNNGDVLRLKGDADARCIVLAGLPLREPIAQYGPFVMNTREQLMQAVEDYRAGQMGPLS